MEGFDLGPRRLGRGRRRGLVGYAYAGDQFRTGELEADLWVHPGHHEPELGGRACSGLAERRAARAGGGARLRTTPLLDVFCIGGQPRQARPAAPARLRS